MDCLLKFRSGGCSGLSKCPVGGHEHDEGQVDEQEYEYEGDAGPQRRQKEEECHQGHDHPEERWLEDMISE